jgi:hypothetical protein
MLAGCSAFVAISLVSYGLAVWPHFVFHQTYQLKILGLDCAIGMLPTAILGAVATRRFGLAAAGGFISGALATAIFLLLRLKQVLLMEGIRDLPQPEFPQSWQYFVPAAWMLTALIVAGLTLKKEEISIE